MYRLHQSHVKPKMLNTVFYLYLQTQASLSSKPTTYNPNISCISSCRLLPQHHHFHQRHFKSCCLNLLPDRVFDINIDSCMTFTSHLTWLFQSQLCSSVTILWYSGITLCMRPATERWNYNAKSSFIGWAHAQNNPKVKIHEPFNPLHLVMHLYIDELPWNL